MLSLKMDNIQLKKKEFTEHYAEKLYRDNVICNMVKFYNQKGFSNFRKKLDKMMYFRLMLKDFLT